MITFTLQIIKGLIHLHKRTRMLRNRCLIRGSFSVILYRGRVTSQRRYRIMIIFINPNNPSVNILKNESHKLKVHPLSNTLTVFTLESQLLLISLSTITLSKNYTNSQQKAHRNQNISNNNNNNTNNNGNDQENPALKLLHNSWSILIKYCLRIQY